MFLDLLVRSEDTGLFKASDVPVLSLSVSNKYIESFFKKGLFPLIE